MNRLCHGLRSIGLDRGDRVLLRLPNVPEFVVAWLACQKLGIVTVGTMPLLRARELAYIATDAGARAAIVWGGLREELERAQQQAPDLKQLIVAGGIKERGEVDELDAMGVDAVAGMAVYSGAMEA